MLRRSVLKFLSTLPFVGTAAIIPASGNTMTVAEALQRQADALGALDMSEWQPIASAPKDGSHVLLFIPEYKRPIHIGWFHDSTTMEYGKVARESRHWMTGAWPSISFNQKDPEPSHWMPLPSGPAEARS